MSKIVALKPKTLAFVETWNTKIGEFKSLREKLLHKAAQVDEWMDHVYHLHVDFLYVLKPLRQGLDNENVQQFRDYLLEYFLIVLVTLDLIQFVKTGRMVREYDKSETLEADIHPIKRDFFSWAEKSRTIRLCFVSLDGYKFEKSRLTKELKKELEKQPAVS